MRFRTSFGATMADRSDVTQPSPIKTLRMLRPQHTRPFSTNHPCGNNTCLVCACAAADAVLPLLCAATLRIELARRASASYVGRPFLSLGGAPVAIGLPLR